MSTLFKPKERSGEFSDDVAETHPDRIMRYCLGKPVAPNGNAMDQFMAGSDPEPSATDPPKGNILDLHLAGSLPDPSAIVPPFGRVVLLLGEKDIHKLWTFDIKRLKRAAEASDINDLQPSLGENDVPRSWPMNHESFAKLGKVADQILYSLWLFSYDDEAFLRKHGFPSLDPERGSRMGWHFQRIGGCLPSLPGQSSFHGPPPKPKLIVTEIEEYCHIVDQITSILAHIACNSSGSSYWKVVILACLAKISTKAKYVALFLPHCIATSLGQHAELMKNPPVEIESDSCRLKQPIVINHCKEYIAVSTWLLECIEHVLRNLGAQKLPYESWEDLDICSLVYEAGVRGMHTQIYQDKWASISGSTDRFGVTWALNSLDLGSILLQTLPPPSQSSSTVDCGNNATSQATINGGTPSRLSSGSNKERGIIIQTSANLKNNFLPVKSIQNIMEFVIIATPLSLASPLLGKGFADNHGAISSRADIYLETPQKVELYNAFFRMQQVGRDSNKDLPQPLGTPIKISPLQEHDETTSLAQSWLTDHRYRPLWRSPPPASSPSRQLNSDQSKVPQPQARDDRSRVKKITDDWVIQENSIVIKYPKYVNTVFGLTVVLVVGGVLCGLLVGSRVEGVDPFNFTAFSWLLGGFVLLVAKVFRVSDWTWRDFLQRQVTCRSVCEVANVSELSEQEVLAYLLSSESYQILRTAGPFQKVFTKNAVDNGFSIDVSPDIQTLAASGIITVKVLTVDGEALVWLRLNPGSGRVQHIPVSGKADSTEIFACVDLSQQGEGSEDLAFNRQKLSWTKVLGVYNAVEKRIR